MTGSLIIYRSFAREHRTRTSIRSCPTECSAKMNRGVREVIEEGARVAMSKSKPAPVRTMDSTGGKKDRTKSKKGGGCVVA
jgi:hypothetical protein